MNLIYTFRLETGENGPNGYCGFLGARDLLNSLLLSIRVSRPHFDKTIVYCDRPAYELIQKDGREFPVDRWVLAFRELQWLSKWNWALAKMYVFADQTRPFFHLDYDAFLWQPLPPQLQSKVALFQNPEPVDWYGHYNESVDYLKAEGIIDPAFQVPRQALNMGCFMGSQELIDSGFIQRYYQTGEDFCKRVQGRTTPLEHQGGNATVFEQLFMQHRLDVEGIENYDTLLDEKWVSRPGVAFTHLMAEAKRQPRNCRIIEEKLRL